MIMIGIKIDNKLFFNHPFSLDKQKADGLRFYMILGLRGRKQSLLNKICSSAHHIGMTFLEFLGCMYP
jgi:hypothetical protein